jgi:DNA-binding PadR family transcriptional regulator
VARENRQLRERLAAAEALIAELRAARARPQERGVEAGVAGQTPEVVSAADFPPDPLQLVIPENPPDPYHSLFSRQEESRRRELIFLALLAGKGYSAELGLRRELVQRIDGVTNPDSGSLRRLILRLEKNNLIQRLPIAMGKYRVIIILLTDLGDAVARAMAIPPVESEWERLMRLHGGERQQKHAAQVCLFTHYARRGGWTTQVCPEVKPPADPDVLLEKDGQRIYVEVEAASGSAERRMKKWRNQRQLQGFTAICAPTENVRRTLVAEASAGGKSGMATDFEWLRWQGKPERAQETDGSASKRHDMDVKLKESIWAQQW